MPHGKDVVSTDLGWAIPTGRFGTLDTGLSLTGIAASALKGTTSLLQRKGYRAEMEIWRPATVSLCVVHASNLPLNDEAVSHLSAMVEKHSEPNTKTLGGMVTLSSLTYLHQWLEFPNGGQFVALAITMLVMYKPADAAEMILSMYRAANRKEDLPSYGTLRSPNPIRSSAICEKTTQLIWTQSHTTSTSANQRTSALARFSCSQRPPTFFTRTMMPWSPSEREIRYHAFSPPFPSFLASSFPSILHNSSTFLHAESTSSRPPMKAARHFRFGPDSMCRVSMSRIWQGYGVFRPRHRLTGEPIS